MIKRWIIFTALFLAACGGESYPVLAPEMTAAMKAYAAQNPYTMGYEVASQCAAQPIRLYWHEGAQRWAVICETSMSHVYGAVMMENTYEVIRVERVNAATLHDLEDLVASVGWEER